MKSNLPSNVEPDQDILFTFKLDFEYIEFKLHKLQDNTFRGWNILPQIVPCKVVIGFLKL